MSITLDKIVLNQGKFSMTADFEIEEGHKVALLGPSGGGKSTLLGAIAGFKLVDEGRIWYRDQDITNMAPAKRPVSLLFQDHNLFPHMSAAQNIGLGIRPNLRLSPAEKAVVSEAMEQVGLGGDGDKMPSEMSGGQQQRVALARALLRDKPVLCLDEPFAALGPALKYEMLDLVDQLVDTTGATLLMVTHQPEDAAYIADQTILIADGKAHAPVDTEQLFSNPPPALAAYLGTKPQKKKAR